MAKEFNPENYSDQQIGEKLYDLRERMVHAERYGQYQMLDQIKSFIQLLEMEQQSRNAKQALMAFNKKNKLDGDLVIGEMSEIPKEEE